MAKNVTIEVNGQKYFCSRDLLIEVSSFFEGMLTSDFREKAQDTIKLIVSEIGFRCFYQYVICKHNHGDMTAENVWHCIDTADYFLSKPYTDVCVDFMSRHFSLIQRYEDFFHLPESILIEILQQPYLHTSCSEVELYKALVSWIEKNPNHSTSCHDILEVINFCEIPSITLGAIKRSGFYKANTQLKELFPAILIKRYTSPNYRPNIVYGIKIENDQSNWHRMGSTLTVDYYFNSFHPAIARGDSRVFILGGWLDDEKRIDDSFFQVSQRYSLKKTKKFGNDMETPGMAKTAFVLDKNLFAIGGAEGQNASVECCKSYQSWVVCQPNAKLPHSHGAAAVHGNMVYVCGGFLGDNVSRYILSYNHVLDTWIHKGDMLEPRFSHCAIWSSDILYIAGGSSPSIETFNPATMNQCKLAVTIPKEPGKLIKLACGDEFMYFIKEGHVYCFRPKHQDIVKDVRFEFHEEDNQDWDIIFVT